jgi:ferredoxin
MRITVDRELCCASGQCARIAPELFDQSDEDGTAVLLTTAALHASQLDDAREAAARCPSTALRLIAWNERNSA